jgi:Ubiquitin family
MDNITSNSIMEDQVSDETVLWTLSIKAIGKLPDDKNSFDLLIGPQSSLDQLQDMITDQTGLPRSCQRLIYRGRLLNDDSSTKIGDIHGLQCGHTIHLVPREVPVSTETAVPDAEAAVEQRDDEVPNEEDDDSDDDFLPTLLDRLFGGASDEDDGEEVTETPAAASNAATADTASSDSSAAVLAVLSSLLSSDEASSTPPTPRAVAAAPASSTTPRRRHVLVPSDLVVPDPGSAEPLRQSLLTLHTMLPTAQRAMSSSSPSSPLEVPRQWYVGQWIDVRDTVNQWLEATIVSIVLPSEILPPSVATTHEATPTRPTPLQHEPVVKATDLDGRIRLLIEPSSEDDNVEGIPAGHRLRSNQHVQLLLIHYNGWPHKWDEWIRSDSERIRPFRVRTRHGASSTLSSPTLVSPWADAPTTRVTAADDDAATTESADERRAVLHELGRVAAQVQELCALVTTTTPLDSSSSRDLPWSRPVETAVATYQQWQAVAPLLDRLGRAMVDAAPHALALAQTMQEQTKVQPPAAAPVEDAVESARNGTLGGFLSLLSRASPETSVSSSNMVATTTTGSTDSILAEPSDERSVDEIDPDFTDFGSGVVNTSRGVARSAPRRSERASTTDELSNALGAYLALASLSGALSRVSNDEDDDDADNSPAVNLARLMRSGGTNGGIDIHIHAIVAAPGTNTTNNNAWANILLAAPRTTSSSSSSSATTTDTSPAAPTASDLWDENGLFDELYSETPAPLNLEATEEAAPSEPAPVVTTAATPPSGTNVTEDGASPTRRRRLSRGATPERQSGSARRVTAGTPPTPTPNGFLSRFFRR